MRDRTKGYTERVKRIGREKSKHKRMDSWTLQRFIQTDNLTIKESREKDRKRDRFG